MPTFEQLLGKDRELCEVPWIARRQAMYVLEDAHKYLTAIKDIQGMNVDDAHRLLEDAAQKLQAEERNANATV